MSPFPFPPPDPGPRDPPAAASLLALPVQGRRQRLYLLHRGWLLPLVKLPLDLVLQLVAHLGRARGSHQGLGDPSALGPRLLTALHTQLSPRWGCRQPLKCNTANPRPAPPPQPLAPASASGVTWELHLCAFSPSKLFLQRPQMPPPSSTSAAARSLQDPPRPTARLGPAHWPLPPPGSLPPGTHGSCLLA